MKNNNMKLKKRNRLKKTDFCRMFGKISRTNVNTNEYKYR